MVFQRFIKNAPSSSSTTSQTKSQEGSQRRRGRVGDSLFPENIQESTSTFSESIGRFFAEVLKVVIISLVIIIPVRTFLMSPFTVRGASMEPTFEDHDYLIISKLAYRLKLPERGDIVVLRDPSKKSQYFIKRIVGLPGERIEITEGQVTIYNGAHPLGIVLDESLYLTHGLRTSGQVLYTLDADEYLVLGDNRDQSLDSRVFGPIPFPEIVGKVWIRAYPLNHIKVFEEVPYQL